MIFKETWQQVLAETKTQTRRLWHEGDYTWAPGELDLEDGSRPKLLYSQVNTHNDRLRYQVGRTYAVQTGRGIPTLCWNGSNPTLTVALGAKDRKRLNVYYREARVRLLAIRREDCRNISEEDAFAEGFGSANAFLQVWTSMYDKPAYKKRPDLLSLTLKEDFLAWRAYLATRPIERYRCFALTFELVREPEGVPA